MLSADETWVVHLTDADYVVLACHADRLLLSRIGDNTETIYSCENATTPEGAGQSFAEALECSPRE